MAEQNLDVLLNAVDGKPVKILDEEKGKLIGEGVVTYSGAQYEKRLSLGNLEIPRKAIVHIDPGTEIFKTLIFVDPKYCEVAATR